MGSNADELALPPQGFARVVARVRRCVPRFGTPGRRMGARGIA